jgi:predicted DNA-binding transcriptional regulator AlpA
MRTAAQNSDKRPHAAVTLIRQVELAEALKLDVSTVIRWTRRGKLPPPIRMGRNTVAWRLSDIDRWLAEREAASSSPQS